jgi:hypothetical protein
MVVIYEGSRMLKKSASALKPATGETRAMYDERERRDPSSKFGVRSSENLERRILNPSSARSSPVSREDLAG